MHTKSRAWPASLALLVLCLSTAAGQFSFPRFGGSEGGFSTAGLGAPPESAPPPEIDLDAPPPPAIRQRPPPPRSTSIGLFSPPPTPFREPPPPRLGVSSSSGFLLAPPVADAAAPDSAESSPPPVATAAFQPPPSGVTTAFSPPTPALGGFFLPPPEATAAAPQSSDQPGMTAISPSPSTAAGTIGQLPVSQLPTSASSPAETATPGISSRPPPPAQVPLPATLGSIGQLPLSQLPTAAGPAASTTSALPGAPIIGTVRPVIPAGQAEGPGVYGVNDQGGVPVSGAPARSAALAENLEPSSSVILTQVPSEATVFNQDEPALPPTSAGRALGPSVAPATLDPTIRAEEGRTTFSSPGCPGASVAIPLGGSSLQSYNTQICQPITSGVPTSLQNILPALTGPVSIDFGGERDIDTGSPLARNASISVGGGRYNGSIAIPTQSGDAWAATVSGYNFAFDEQGLNVTIDGQTVTVPLGLSAGRRRLTEKAPASSLSSLARQAKAAAARSLWGTADDTTTLFGSKARGQAATFRRSLAQAAAADTATPASIFALRMVLTKCSPPQPVSGAEVTALVSGFDRINYPIPLEQGSDGSAAYTGLLNMDELFPNLQYYLTTTVSFCQSNQANIQVACSIGAGANTFANSSILLSACASFLTDGTLRSLSRAPTQVVLACSILGVQMSLLCSSQENLNCAGVAQNTFTISVDAQATGLPGIYENRTASLGAIYQNVANGVPGAVYLQSIDSVNETDVEDDSCGVCADPASPLYVGLGQACTLNDPMVADTCCPDNQLVCNGTLCVPYCNPTTDAACDFCLSATGQSSLLQSCSTGLNATAAAIALPPSLAL